MLLYKSGFNIIKDITSVKCVSPFSFAKNTTYGLGGFADIAYYPKNICEARIVLDYIKSNNIPYVIVGLGSNILASDKEYKGVVISTKFLKGIFRVSENKIFCLSGTDVKSLLEYCKNSCLGGAEFLYGIPATMGGAAFMNAGVNGKYIGDIISSVRIFDNKTVVFNKEECNFRYKRSTMRDINASILGVTLELIPKSRQEILKEIEFCKDRRKHLPGGRSCGCVFKNFTNISAGQLIEASGLKGYRIGGAVVSNLHANFILNEGGTANDVFKLISLVKDRVYKSSGVFLEEEVVYIGDFNDTDS